jgi:hypothetical protein
MMRIQLVWGCDPARQLEVAWLRHLLGAALVGECPWWRPEDPGPDPMAGALPVLVESGLLRLERSPAPERVAQLLEQRRARLAILERWGRFGVIHLSDEEGVDAESWYRQLPRRTPIWRNFPHRRLEANPQVLSLIHLSETTRQEY